MQSIESATPQQAFYDMEGRIGDIDFDMMILELRDATGAEVSRVSIHFESDLVDEIAQWGGGRVRAIYERSMSGKYHPLTVFEALQSNSE